MNNKYAIFVGETGCPVNDRIRTNQATGKRVMPMNSTFMNNIFSSKETEAVSRVKARTQIQADTIRKIKARPVGDLYERRLSRMIAPRMIVESMKTQRPGVYESVRSMINYFVCTLFSTLTGED